MSIYTKDLTILSCKNDEMINKVPQIFLIEVINYISEISITLDICFISQSTQSLIFTFRVFSFFK